MELSYYINKIKFQLTGDILESELNDNSFNQIMDISLQELSRYYNTTRLVDCKPEGCIDLLQVEKDNDIKIQTVVSVYRDHGVGSTSNTTSVASGPMFISQWNFGNSYYGSSN